MAINHRLWTIGVLIACFATAQPSIAADLSSTPLPATNHFRFTLDPGFLAANPSLGLPQSESAFAGQIRQGRPYRSGGRSRSRSVTALTIGTIAAIAGTAVLVYANRPECNSNQSAGGCGYGTKVIGGAVLTGGVAGLVIGAVTW